ncbi:glutathione peroxidase [Vagococcus fluvialis]|uniref:glutathione peroxidase n=1 Tax=Vagococcus fluvialis TaxID=2738 RepID=UPI003B591F11
MSIYQFSMEQMDGNKKDLIDYQGKVVLIVNTASKCGFTQQFSGLETLYNTYKEKDFVVLGFPCSQFLNQELKTNDSILEFCQVNYGVTFPMFAKIKVRGKEKSPLYDYLIQETDNKSISWNFTKFLINQEGQVVNRFAPKIVPESIEDEIKKLLA